MVTTETTILTPLIAFPIFLLVGYAIYRIGGRIAPAVKATEEALTSYACGEDIPGQRAQPTYRLYHVGIAFTFLHIAALLVATMPLSETVVGLGFFLLAITAISLFAILRSGIEA